MAKKHFFLPREVYGRRYYNEATCILTHGKTSIIPNNDGDENKTFQLFILFDRHTNILGPSRFCQNAKPKRGSFYRAKYNKLKYRLDLQTKPK